MGNNDETAIDTSGGNVFADLGPVDPDGRPRKVQLARAIARVIGRKRWTQREAAQVLCAEYALDPALVSRRLAGFSVERLDVAMSVRPKPSTRTGRLELAEVAGP